MITLKQCMTKTDGVISKMSRPMPTILDVINNKKLLSTKYVIEVDAVYTVLYDNKLFATKVEYFNGPFKYKSCTYSTIGAARLNARKLNDEYGTDKFTVHKLHVGEPIDELAPKVKKVKVVYKRHYAKYDN